LLLADQVFGVWLYCFEIGGKDTNKKEDNQPRNFLNRPNNIPAAAAALPFKK
jgi:hypothetical protein